MKERKLTLILALVLTSSLVFGQDYAFKVMANKGSNEVKSGDAWQPLKTGASLKSTDELKLVDNAYIGLIHASGKPLEVRQSGNYKVADLAAKVGGGSSVLNKYTDFILSSNAEGKKNRLSATGAVHRASGTHTIHVHLPENQNSAVYNNAAIVTWDTEVVGPYVVTVSNMASEELTTYEVTEKSTTIDLKDPKYKFNTPGDPFSAGLIVQVKSKKDAKQISKEYMIRALPSKDAEKVKESLSVIINEVTEPTAINKYYLAGFYEQNNLLIDAIAAYEEAVKLEPAYQEYYDEFLLRHNLKRQ
jgi:hypothetical protein